MEKDAREKTKKGNKKKSPSTVFVNVSNTRFSIVRLSVEGMGYKITESTTKPLLFWCDSGGSFDFASQLSQWQFYNHFPGTWAIARKVDLARNIEKMARLLPEYYHFHPKSFIIPTQFSEMESYMNSIPKKKSRKTFIIKPDRGSFGKGIILIQDPEAISDYIESAIAQQYIEPYLIDGLKFDLRIYALVSSIEPLRIYLFNEGIGRFCTELYEKPKANNLELSYAHLTNYALNKTNPNFQQPTDADHADTGHKRSLSCILEHMRNDGIDTNELLSSIEDIIRLTVISIQPYLSTNYKAAIPSANDKKSRCFEILGFDILIDKKLKPWLLEVNWSPSLATESPFDKVLKKNVITDTLKIINIPPNFKQLVTKRKKEISLRRTITKDSMDDIDNLWDPDEETRISESTGWKLIYPLNNNNNSKREMAEIALAVSKASPVGASVSVSQARVLKESIIAQLKDKNFQIKQTPQISERRKSVQFPETFSIQTSANLATSVKNVTNKRLLHKTATTGQINSPQPPSESIPRPQLMSQRSQRLTNDPLFQNKILKTSSSTVVPNATFASSNSPSTDFQNFDTDAAICADLACFKGQPIIEVEERRRKFALKRQALIAQSLSIPSYCSTMCVTRANKNVKKVTDSDVNSNDQKQQENSGGYNGCATVAFSVSVKKITSNTSNFMPRSLPPGRYTSRDNCAKSGGGAGSMRQSIAKSTATQSIFKPMTIVQRQTMFC